MRLMLIIAGALLLPACATTGPYAGEDRRDVQVQPRGSRCSSSGQGDSLVCGAILLQAAILGGLD